MMKEMPRPSRSQNNRLEQLNLLHFKIPKKKIAGCRCTTVNGILLQYRESSLVLYYLPTAGFILRSSFSESRYKRFAASAAL